MAIGVTNTTVPMPNDIILGEFKLYGNYGLPTQIQLGATREGLKLAIEREIKELKSDGCYGAMLDANGVPLRRYETFRVMLTVEQLCLKYMNNDVISDAESDGAWESNDWGGTGGTYTAEDSIVLEGDQSAKCTADTLDYGIHEVFSASKDLTTFANGESSTTSDYIGFALYLTEQDITDLGSANIQMGLHMDAEGTETNQYTYDVAPSALSAGWNTFKVAKSGFTEVGTGDWSSVTGVSFKLDLAPSAEVVFYVDSISLLQAQNKSTIVPVNGAGMSYTDEGDYKEFTPDLEIQSNEFYENVTLVGQKHDGKTFLIMIKNVINDGEIELSMENKDEVVNSTQFTAHYKKSSPTTTPIIIREYVA